MMYPEVRYFYCLGCDPNQPRYTDGSNIRICKSFLDKLWRDPAYEECGVMKSNPCPSNWVDEDMDPYMCGDTLELPKQVYDNNVTLFINAYKPPGLEDFDFVMHDDSGDGVHECWSAPAFGSNSAGASRSSSVFVTVAIMAMGLVARVRL